ncbi:MAG: DUF1045 domain-containing protein [Beijerinckiaceae bacterium]|nr:DUF1045 domain-containing protein [Beijerinckiaceae bacterium]
MTRYALYYAPDANTPLWRFGSSCLGYDAWCNRDVPHPHHSCFAGLDLDALTAEPRRYGFHATLKAPFELREGTSEDDLLAFAAAFASAKVAFELRALTVSNLGGFIALTPPERCPPLHDLADAATRELDDFRAPLSAADLERRLAQGLSDRQRRNLADFGYPYIFEDFRFHMTLTGAIDADTRDRVAAGLRDLYAPIDRPVAIDAITIFRQMTRASRFTALKRLPFKAA